MNVHEIIQECQEEAELGNDVARVVFLAVSGEGLGYREYGILSRIFMALSDQGDYLARDGDTLLDALENMGFWEES